ncbi:Hsp70 family protein [Mucisphaera calidilacus]|uniref:Chaperone protein DnaK n=1 Tax=Mucisphaera calidilacus TaxID=2527982 RepID=A0A518C182_9BACT|nr:Hsp70 family protein [Mucisphaera calidilacus]QDU72979.1 Chaperone protein DnaK [Mucisphaera calidilacus]
MPEPTQDTPQQDPIVGIDLGTSHSLVAWCDAAGPRVLHQPDHSGILPSVVRYSENGTVEAVGDHARAHAVEFPERTVASVKRLMGRGINDLTDDIETLPYTVEPDDRDTVRIALGSKRLSPQEVSATILRQLKTTAEAALGQTVRRAVITVPAYFDDAQRQATRDAGRIAGLDVLRILNEPTAAALAYNIGLGTPANNLVKQTKPETVTLSTKLNPEACADDSQRSTEKPAAHDETVVVYDLGGGTFDVSILRIRQTPAGLVDQVLATAGDTHLGGDDIDQTLIELFRQEIAEQFNVSGFPATTRQAFKRLAEQTKIQLSQAEHASVEIDLGDNRVYQRTIQRDEFDTLITPLVQQTLDACANAQRAAKRDTDQIDRVILVGGSTRIPLVRSKVAEHFGREPYTALDPDTVVALGASIQAAILAGLRKDALLLDVVPLSLGIETMGGAVAKLIVANTTIPARATEFFSTYADNQTGVDINVYQGERELVQDCRLLGRFQLKGIPPMPAGLPKVEVTFLVDANGILSVEAVEKRSERRAAIQIIPNHGLTREEVSQMEADALGHAAADMTAHRLIDLRNQARLDLRAIDKQLAKAADDLADDQRTRLETNIAAVREFLEAEQPDPDDFYTALDAMDKASIPLAEKAIARTLREDAARA